MKHGLNADTKPHIVFKEGYWRVIRQLLSWSQMDQQLQAAVNLAHAYVHTLNEQRLTNSPHAWPKGAGIGRTLGFFEIQQRFNQRPSYKDL